LFYQFFTFVFHELCSVKTGSGWFLLLVSEFAHFDLHFFRIFPI
jgi:hypothetical protein